MISNGNCLYNCNDMVIAFIIVMIINGNCFYNCNDIKW